MKKELSTPAKAAAAIRQELKEAFPGIVFRITSKSYSMGDHVSIHWEDGPLSKDVKAITGKYQYGHFNGMDDIYEHTNSRDDIPQTKYVMESRSISKETEAILLPLCAEYYNKENFSCHTLGNFVYQLVMQHAIPAGATVTAVIPRTEYTPQLGGPAACYEIVFSTEAKALPAPVEKIEVPAGEVTVIEYSEKSVAVIGETYPIRKQLGEIGGKFNRFLTCGPGWIFSKNKIPQIKELLKVA